MWFERGERIVGNLGLGSGHRRDERRLARVGEPDQRDVGHQFELEVEPELLAGLALLGEGRRAAAVGQEASVAATALATFGHERAQAGRGHVHYQLPGAIPHDGADGQGDVDVLAPRPVALLTRSVPAVRGAAERMVPEAKERRLVLGRYEPDVAAMATVAAVGAAPVDVRFASPRHRAGAAVARGAWSWA